MQLEQPIKIEIDIKKIYQSDKDFSYQMGGVSVHIKILKFHNDYDIASEA